ncbi:MAG: POT family proton-dependent oligopeptide transporter [Myxococcota bacterium]|jgi:POT family proton-dependent oligopeptide transporter
MSSQSAPAPSDTLGGHPKGLYILFFAEAWERFSYYGMRALLTLYMVNHLSFDRTEALQVYATYTGLVYLTPFIGGLLADQVLGSRKSVIIGGLIMVLGHLAMAFEPLLYPALGLLIIGNGFFKPNISTIVGGLYEPDDARRDGGFTIFYMGINLGAFFSPLVCGTLGEQVGWHWGFSAAAGGMLCGLAVFLWGQRFLGGAGYPPDMNNPPPGTSLRTKDWADIAIWTIGGSAMVWVILFIWPYLSEGLDLIPAWLRLIAGLTMVLGTIAGLIGTAARDGKEAWQQTAVIIILAIFVVFFWMGFEQAGGTMTLFADEQTDRSLMGFEIPASWFQSINPLAIIILAPIFSVMWQKVDESRYRLATPTKMALGMIILGLGFVVMFIAQGVAEETGSVGPLWLAGVYLIHTVGELFLSPIGLSMVTKLSVPRMVSLMMGVWFTSSAVANYAAGRLEEFVSHYDLPVFGFLIGSSIGAGLLLLLMVPLLKKWMHGRG